MAPSGGGAQDYLDFFDRDLNPVVGSKKTALAEGEQARIPVGPAGGLASTSGRLNVTDKSISYQITESNSAGADVLAALKGVGEVIALAASVVQAATAVANAVKPAGGGGEIPPVPV